MSAAVIWRSVDHWLIGEQAATALGLSVADFEQRSRDRRLVLVSKIGAGGRKLYSRDAVRAMILAGG